jgi:hypothetical protein
MATLEPALIERPQEGDCVEVANRRSLRGTLHAIELRRVCRLPCDLVLEATTGIEPV